MRSFVIVLLCGALLGAAGAVSAAWVDPNLEDQIAAATSDAQYFKIYVTLRDAVDLGKLSRDADRRGLGRAQRHYEVLTALQEKAAETQSGLLALAGAAQSTREIKSHHAFWIANAIAFEAKAAFVDKLAARPDVLSIYLDYPIELIEPVGEPVMNTAPSIAAIEAGITSSRAPELWALGIDGTGALACDQDTGADGNHPAFASRWRGLEGGVTPAEAWFDPVAGQTFPTDSGYHGTHTLGTILGDDGGANQIGMAPGAKWIGAKTIDVPGGNIFSDAVGAFQWSADPDGNPGTMDDVPDVVNNSWGLHIGYYGSCRTDFNAFIDAAEAAGVVVVFAAGNEGPGATSLRSPGNRIASQFNTFAVGSLLQGGTAISSFSSRGPSDCDNATIKPEISAVGSDVRSSMPGNQYGNLSGTSMATPHVAGAVLLLRGAFPEATVEEAEIRALVHGRRPRHGRRGQHVRQRPPRRLRGLFRPHGNPRELRRTYRNRRPLRLLGHHRDHRARRGPLRAHRERHDRKRHRDRRRNRRPGSHVHRRHLSRHDRHQARPRRPSGRLPPTAGRRHDHRDLPRRRRRRRPSQRRENGHRGGRLRPADVCRADERRRRRSRRHARVEPGHRSRRRDLSRVPRNHRRRAEL
ncbi:MAG: S8 family serine peptidase [Deltaproteobacteria bacterium]|nr:S8 family serine peptidase [Deltaproteobacteria bacterium]